jgi:AI-2 transport system substrate-binding protein/rhamnose transport system substrate-binding protein
MVRIRRIPAPLAFVACLGALALVGCGSNSPSSSTSPSASRSSARTASAAGAVSTGAPIRVAIVPKLLGLPVFEANVAGAQQVAESLGIDLTYAATSTASATGQVSVLESLIKEKVNVITLSANDPTIPDPVLEQAMKAGIRVISFDSDVNPLARDFFIQDTAYNTIARGVIDAAVKAEGPDAELGIMSSTPDATIQQAWISAMKAYARAEYPHLTWAPIGYGQSVATTSLTQAEGMINSNPNLKAILPIDGAAVVGTAQAITALGETGKIGVFGIGDPLPNRHYFANGSLQALFLWNEVNQGKLVMYVAKLADENKLQAGSSFTTPLGTFTVSAAPNATTGATKNTIIFSTPLEFTKSNYLQYDF